MTRGKRLVVGLMMVLIPLLGSNALAASVKMEQEVTIQDEQESTFEQTNDMGGTLDPRRPRNKDESVLENNFTGGGGNMEKYKMPIEGEGERKEDH